MVLKIDKVRDPEMIYQIISHNPGYLGFDFRHDSHHYVGEVDEAIYSRIPIKIRKCGIFENDDPLYILYIAGRFSLSTIQLEGNEPIHHCELLAAEGVELIKVLNNITQVEKYEGVCNKFIVRDAELLARYRGKTPIIVDQSILSDCHSVYGVDIEVGRFLESCAE